MINFEQARRNMIDNQLRPCDVKDPLLLQAIQAVPRERFIGSGREVLAYVDQNVVLSENGERRCMLQPMVQARLLQALNLLPGEKVLEVACGHGYASALMAELGATVIALEDNEELAAGARERLAGAAGVSVVTGSLSDGAPQHAPFDAILVNGAAEVVPEKLLGQLRDGGRLVVVQKDGEISRAILYTRSGTAFGKREIIDVRVPVLNAFRKDSAFAF